MHVADCSAESLSVTFNALLAKLNTYFEFKIPPLFDLSSGRMEYDFPGFYILALRFVDFTIIMLVIMALYLTDKIINMKYLIFILLLFLTGCTQRNDESPSKKLLIGFSQCTMIDEWRQEMVEEMKREITFYRDYDIELVVKDAGDDTENQIADIEDLVSNGIDLLIVSPNEEEPLTSTVEKVFDKGIPVIIIDRKINSTKYSSFIGADNFNIGKEAGYFASQLLNGKGKILEITGLIGSTPARERSLGFHQIIDKIPDIQTVKTIEGSWLENKTLRLTDSLFREFKEFDLIFAHNDFMAYAAAQSARKQNMKPYVIGVDGMNTASGGISKVIEGYLDGTILYPSGGDKAIQLAIDILSGKSFDRNIDLSTYRIDRTNARTLWLQGRQIEDQQGKIDKQTTQVNELSELLQKRRIILLMTYTTIVLLILTVLIILLSWRHKSKMNKILDNKNKTISQQNEIITKQRDDSLDLLIVAEEARENKLRLFTDLSHEFRTVVSLIINPIHDILNSTHDDILKSKVLVLQRSAERLARLTDSILKFRSIENNKYQLNFFSANIAQYVSNIVDTFREHASQKQITLTSHIEDEVYAEFDLGVIEKVMYNLLSNAIKFNRDGGTVTVSLQANSSNIQIKVQDSGYGIPSNELPFLFSRFHKINNPNHTPNKDSIGIGLALSKELIQLHGGKVAVNSIMNEGTSFEISIPRFHHLPESKVIPHEVNKVDLNIDREIDKSKTILVVEDNLDLQIVISDIVGKHYSVISANNGKEGLSMAIKKSPDLVLSDILMPVMDGMKMCIQIKENPLTCHIPVILLTAIDSEENILKGIEIGADAYITKPFNEYLLLSNIKNLIESREKIKKFFCPSPILRNIIQTKDDAENEFINNCIAHIYENIKKEDYTLSSLAEAMNMSRSSLYRKLRDLTKLKPVDFIKKAKLSYAAKLILTNDALNINEIAWQSGFSDARYFSKCFYQEYDVYPSHFSRENTTDNKSA